MNVGHGSTPPMDYRDLVGRLDFARTTGHDVTFSADEAWWLREHIRALAGEPLPGAFVDTRPSGAA